MRGFVPQDGYGNSGLRPPGAVLFFRPGQKVFVQRRRCFAVFDLCFGGEKNAGFTSVRLFFGKIAEYGRCETGQQVFHIGCVKPYALLGTGR